MAVSIQAGRFCWYCRQRTRFDTIVRTDECLEEKGDGKSPACIKIDVKFYVMEILLGGIQNALLFNWMATKILMRGVSGAQFCTDSIADDEDVWEWVRRRRITWDSRENVVFRMKQITDAIASSIWVQLAHFLICEFLRIRLVFFSHNFRRWRNDYNFFESLRCENSAPWNIHRFIYLFLHRNHLIPNQPESDMREDNIMRK